MREILFQISAAAALTAVVKALIPAERYEKQFRVLLSCFFTVIAVSAFTDVGELPEIAGLFSGGTSYADYTVQVKKQTASEVGAAVREGIRERLNAENIFPEKIYVGVNISGEANISISEIRLVFTGAGAGELQRAVSVTKGLTGQKIPVTAENGER